MNKLLSIALTIFLLGGLITMLSCAPLRMPSREPLTMSSYAPHFSTIRVGDIEMAYRIHGQGPPLIMIMGFSGTMDLWDPNVLKALSTRFKVAVFDNRGMGGTTAGKREFTIEQFADDTAGLMNALGIDHAHVLGWSMGTEIALELTLRYASKIDKLVLYAADCSMQAFPPTPDVIKKLTDTSGSPKERGNRLVSLMFPQDWLSTHGEYLEEVFSRPMESSSPENIKRQANAMENWKGCCDLLPQIKTETLLITGTEDVLTPPQNSHVIVKKIPNARLVTFEGGGHGVMYQFHEKFSERVIRFLEDATQRQ